MASPSDIEKGLAHGDARLQAQSSTTRPTDEPGSSELEVFQALVGIHFLAKGGNRLPDSEQRRRMIEPPSPFRDIFTPSKMRHIRFRNRGLYDRVLSQELRNRTMYSLSHYIISGLYLLQILFAATFTALSAYKRVSSVPLTVLGALNTVIAGLLAWLTGQGMPVRFRAARDQYREVVKSIETSERMFAEIDHTKWPPGKRPDPIRERDRLETLYKEALADQQANYPEAHNTPTADKKTEQNKELQVRIEESKEQEKEGREKIGSLERKLTAFELMMEDPGKVAEELPEGSSLRKALEQKAKKKEQQEKAEDL